MKLLSLALTLGAASTLAAQTPPAAPPAGAVSARANRGNPQAILASADSTLATDSLNYEALWRGALALVDIGSAVAPDRKSAMRDSAFVRAEQLARRAVRVNGNDTEGHFALAVALGSASLTKSPRERVRAAEEVYREAHRAIALDSTHDGAYHVLGRWHAEMLRVSGVERFFAKEFLGGAIFKQASWDSAETDLRRAVTLDSTRITHHLDLAGVYADRKRWNEARRELDAVRDLPATAPNDTLFKRQGELLRARIAGKGD